MKRPDNLIGRIRYYGLTLAEIAAQCAEQGIPMFYEIDIRLRNMTVYFGGLGSVQQSYSAEIMNENQLNRFEANIYAEMTIRGEEETA
jgi:hypothetical protein